MQTGLFYQKHRVKAGLMFLTGMIAGLACAAPPPPPHLPPTVPSTAIPALETPGSAVLDPMETVREHLKKTQQALQPVDPPVAAEAPADTESLDMERLRARLTQRLGVRADMGQPNELRLKTRTAAAPVVAAARLAANTPRQGRAAGAPASTPQGAARPASHSKSASQVAPPKPGEPWSYEGANGPQAWAQLKPEYAMCGSGKKQSPVDIRDGIRLNLDPLVFDYNPTPVKVHDDGRSLYATSGPGNTLTLRGRRYELRHVQLHTPAEDHIQGRVFDMSVSLVHQDVQGRWLVLSVMLERGQAQPVLQTLLDHMPLEKSEEVQTGQPLDWRGLLPANHGYYIYMGSLSTPPCTEGVVRIVMKTPMQVSPEQLAVLARLYAFNARPVQLSAGRVVKESN